ncbi:highly reducing polyketide synthase easB-like [Anneissia japonica]|uniref:highly reducing polyketide synthase easB-like n=1 Tax=Anneissia japonica TaxID=1529436 RepID=UPI001425A8EB|nr:highly reducing polyketide synthase easB-like [Anneissia japonica]
MENASESGTFPVAIIGMGCRMPGGVTSTEDFWKVLQDGKECITEVPADRWSLDAFYDKEQGKQGKIVTRRSGFIDGIDKFDSIYFRISPKEAAAMDPQQRILLEVTHEAFEDAGIIPEELQANCGVFVGIGLMDYAIQTNNTSTIDPYVVTGSAHSVAANRLSYAFNLKGPSYAVDTACASSMTAMHLACSALRNRECEIAVLGGANALIIPETSAAFSSLGVLSPDGKCCPFSDSANGYVRGEGWGTMILKPLDQALLDNDHVYATIIGTSISANGYSQSLTMPSVSAQQQIMEETYRRFGVNMADVEYIEAHGTGTPVGDPIEAEAIGKAFGPLRTEPLKVGSVKSNFGHSECAAGVVATIKTVLMLNKGILVPTINYTKPNPKIQLEDWKLQVQTTVEPLRSNGKAIVGINSFGFAGALAHAILQESPRLQHNDLPDPMRWSFGEGENKGKPMIVPLSGKSLNALHDLSSKWIDFECEDDAMHAISWQATHRKHHENRLAVIASSGQEFRERLRNFNISESGQGICTGTANYSTHKICFIFPGQGQQWVNMGRQLYRTEPVFRNAVNKCDAIFSKISGWSLIQSRGLFNGHLEDENMVNDENINDMEISQPSIVFLQIGLYELWRHWGLQPDVVVGHSLGEVAAAYACGGLTLTEAITVIYHRSKNQALLKGAGSMVAARLTHTEALELCAKHDDLFIAAENASGSVTLAGSEDSVLSVVNDNHIKAKQLRVQCAFHTPYMDPMEKPFRASMEGAVTTPPGIRKVPFYSTLTGEHYKGDFETEYWWGNIRSTVKFETAITNILQDIGANIFIECAASATLVSSVKQIAKEHGQSDIVTLASGHRQQDDRISVLNAVGQLYIQGVPLEWKNITSGVNKWVDIPKYPWQHESFWKEPEERYKKRLGKEDLTFKGQHGNLSLNTFSFLADHVVRDKVVFPAAGYVEYALQSFFQEDECPSLYNVTFKRVCTWKGNDAGNNESQYLKLQCAKNGNLIEITSDNSVFSDSIISSSSNAIENEPFDIDAIYARCSEHQEKEEFYDRLGSLGLNYGPAFQVVSDVQVGDGEILGTLSPPEDNKQRIQTTQLDGCFQLLLQAVGEKTTLYLPVGIKSIRMHVAKLPPFEEFFAYARINECDSIMMSGDVFMISKCGQILAKLIGVHFKNIDGVKSDTNIDDCLYQTVWQPSNSCMTGTSTLKQVFNENHLNAVYSDEMEKINRVQEHTEEIKEICVSFISHGLESVSTKDIAVHPRYLERLRHIVADTSIKKLSYETIHQKLKNLDENIPELKHELEMIRCLGENFTKTLVDPGSAVKLLFRPECLPSYFMDSLTTRLFYKAGTEVIHKAVQCAAEKKQVVRVLEVGGRMGGLAKYVLEPLKHLGEQHRLEYIFTDLSVTFFMHAKGTLDKYPFVKYQQLDIEKDLAGQGFVPGSIDLIVCLDTIHSVVDVDDTLSRVNQLLVDDGLFLMYEATNTHFISELVFGSLDLCWVFQDSRKDTCWLSKEEWAESMSKNGFVQVESASTPEEFFHSVLLGKKPSPMCQQQDKRTTSQSNYMIICDQKSEMSGGIEQNLNGNVKCETLQTLDKCGLSEISNESAQELIYLWSDSDNDCHFLLKLIQHVDANPDVFARVWFVTSGSNMDSTNIDGSKAIGMLRAVSNQCQTPIFTIDTDPNSSPSKQAELLVKYISFKQHGEREIVIRNNTYLYPRLTHLHVHNENVDVKTPFWQLTQNDSSPVASLDDLGVSYTNEITLPPPGKILVRVKCTALNFKDVMMALGMLEELVTLEGRQFGLEMSGIVVKVGEGVTHIQEGDKVIGFGEHCFASHAICDANFVIEKPINLSWEESAGVSIVFATSYHSLVERANLQEGETVLIHSACGGVGLSAIQVAKMIGANIICSAGTQRKRHYLKDALGIQHVTNSRSDSFYDDIMKWTDGKGVDVVLNSLGGDLLTKGIQCLAPGGRFCEIGKRDILKNSALQMHLLLENKSFLSCQIDFMIKLQKPKIQSLLQTVGKLLEAGSLKPVNFEVSSIENYQEVLARTAKGSHIGKMIFSIPDEVQPPKINKTSKIFKNKATYIITGGFGGIGLAMSRWLALKGAQYIALVSRRGCRNSAGRRTTEFLRRKGVTVYEFAIDISKSYGVEKLRDELRMKGAPPVKGIFHLAGYIAEESLQSLTYDEADAIISSKATSAQLLDAYTQDFDLDIFFMLSSVTATWGHSSQPMYIAANNFLDSLAEKRRSNGLPSLSVQLGPVRGAGYLESRSDVTNTLALKGHHSLHVDEFLEVLSTLLQSSNIPAVVCLANQDWSATQMFSYKESLKYNHLAVSDNLSKTECALSLQDVEQRVLQKLGMLLCLDAKNIDINQPMVNYGVDSLMAVEMVTWASKELNVVVSQLDILGGITTKLLLEKAINNDVVLPLKQYS